MTSVGVGPQHGCPALQGLGLTGGRGERPGPPFPTGQPPGVMLEQQVWISKGGSAPHLLCGLGGGDFTSLSLFPCLANRNSESPFFRQCLAQGLAVRSHPLLSALTPRVR